MRHDQLKDLLFGHVKDSFDANVLYARQEHSRVQARHRSTRSRDVEYTPFEEVRDQDPKQVRSINHSASETGDTR